MDDSTLSADRAAKRRAILDSAIENFAERGFFNSRTRDIARAAGVAEGTIYLYFEGKDDLLLTAFREKVTDFCNAADALLAEGGRFEATFGRFVELQFAGIEVDPNLATVLLLESRQSTRFYGEPVRDVLREYAAAVDRLLLNGRAERAIDDDIDIPLARRMLIGSLEEIEVEWLLGPQDEPLTKQAEAFTRTFLRGIVPWPDA